ncbi:M55 family metallopeptidase [Rouxiella sp. WC2420]|uniref:M55 family metallopeptidase n=1 Tax=Rouxiella sp. WC2420 TaxID=3234145 RepID=A0AB39VKW1_9GAMM
MKVFISADIEGIAGVMRPEQCSPGNVEYETARGLMEQEVNAAIAGAFEGGATQVVVADSHAMMQNLRAANIDSRARLVQGKPRGLSMLEGLEQGGYDGLMFVGFHSAAGEFGVLAHTINGRAFYRIKINGSVMGETDLYAALGAELDVPLWMVTGDDQLEKWVMRHYPAADYVCVKRAISANAAESISPEFARDKIRQQAAKSVKNAGKGVERRFGCPYRLELMVAKPVLADLFCMIPGVERIDAITVGYSSPQIAAIISLLGTFSYLATTQK